MLGVQGDDVLAGSFITAYGCVCVGWCQGRQDLLRISRKRGGGQSSQKPRVRRSSQSSRKVRVLSGYQRAPWEQDMANQDQISLQGLTIQTKASKHIHTMLAY